MAMVAKAKAGAFKNIKDKTSRDKRIHLAQIFADSVDSPPKKDLDVWADLHYKLPKETSSEYGPWRTARFPFLRRIMKCLSPSSKAKEITAIKGAQLGFTEIAKCWQLYTTAEDPGPMMYVQKTKEAAEDYSTQKLEPTIEICPIVKDTLGSGKPKKLSNTWDNKGFPGGFHVMGGANSGAFLRSKSIAKAVADEEDSYKANIDGEGSPVVMIRKRMSNFPFSKFFRISTPRITETSTIEPAYNSGSQEQCYVPCPECNPFADPKGTYWTIKWKNIIWDKDSKDQPVINPDTGIPDNIGLLCEDCGCIIEEHRKTWMLENHLWMSEKGSKGEPYEVGDVEYPTFQINSLYSPLGFFSWRDAVKEWFTYLETGDKALLQGFINQTLGETYSLAGKDVSSTWLHSRCEEYTHEVPKKALVLTAGVDVQGDRLEVEILGHGLLEETFSIAYRVFWGNPDYLGDENGLDSNGDPTVWKTLDEFLYKRYQHESGVTMPVECTAVDSRYKTEIVHKYCRLREHRKIFPVRGRDGWGKGLIERPKRRSEKFKTWAFTAWVDELKDKTYSLLMVDRPGPGFQHFPNNEEYTEKHFNGLTSESKKIKYVSGSKVLYWDCPKGVRNEQLDVRNYAYAAFVIYAPNLQYRAEQDTPIPMQSDQPLQTKTPTKGSKPRHRKIGGIW